MANRHARDLRRRLTAAEAKLWFRLRRRSLDGARFRRQAPIGPFIADFVCFEANLIVEVDGSQHVRSDADRARDEWFTKHGYSVLRVWNSDVLGNIDAVLEAIAGRLRAGGTPLPGPPPQGGREGR